jgi:hypothetical protein
MSKRVSDMTPDELERRRANDRDRWHATGKADARRERRNGNAPAAPSAEPRTVAVMTAAQRAADRDRVRTLEHESLVTQVRILEDELAFLHAAPSAPPTIKAPRSRPKSGLRTADPVFLISDLHYGERVTRAETLGENEYDIAIAQKRMSKCWDNMLWLRKDMSRTQTCDNSIVCGDIHDELRETNDGGMLDQCDAAFDGLYPGLEAMADATPGQLHVLCIGGNHGRLTHKQHIKNGTQHSAEHLGVYGPLRKVMGAGKKGNIVWHIPNAERYIFDIFGKRMSLQHGTMIRSQGGIGGTLVPMTRWVTRAADADLYLFGHFHEADAYGKIVKNGSLIGPSAYTKWLGIEDRPPEQVCFSFDAVRGVRRFERVSVSEAA